MFRAIWDAIVRGKRRKAGVSWRADSTMACWMVPDDDGFVRLVGGGTSFEFVACGAGEEIPWGAARVRKGKLAHFGLVDLEQESPSHAFLRATRRVLAKES